MEGSSKWNTFIAIGTVALLVVLSPHSVQRLVSNPVGVAVIILAILSLTAHSPALGIIALALVITENQEVEGFADWINADKRVFSDDKKREMAAKMTANFDKSHDWVSSNCFSTPAGLAFRDTAGNKMTDQDVTNLLGRKGVALGEGCTNPCAKSCVVRM